MVGIIECFFCGSNIEEMKNDEFIKERKIKIDRYFKDKRKGFEKIICQICGPHYMQRQFVEVEGLDSEGMIDGDKFTEWVLKNFEKIMLKSK